MHPKQAPMFKFHIMDGNEAHQISQRMPNNCCEAISSPCNKQYILFIVHANHNSCFRFLKSLNHNDIEVIVSL